MDLNLISRRSVLGSAGLLWLPPTLAQAQAGRAVETTEGRYRGLQAGGVHVFKGMRYGASTAGAGRFMPPRAPERFAGVRDASDYADQAPQGPSELLPPGPVSEDCLRINVWTPGVGDRRRRPVLLWFHGGGFEAGSGTPAIYDGTRMARRGDVVVCTINHRLNVLGHCDLSGPLGRPFRSSGNVGFLDLVRAMQWVRANIAAFGGDPSNVLIYGQSGGGRKVSLCYASKSAQGLFAKGVVQSGSHLLVQTPEQSGALTSALLKALDIAPGEALRLQQVPVDLLQRTQRAVIAKAGYRFEPVLDGVIFDRQPFWPTAPQWSARIPMMVGTTITELSNQLGRDPAVYRMDQAGLKTRLKSFVGPENVDEAVRVFAEAHPQAEPSELYFRITSARSYIRNAAVMAETRDALSGSRNPTWMYQLTWRSPAEGGRRVSQHTLDLPFMFDNVDKALHLTGPQSDDTRAMTEAMAGAWLNFARTGNPNGAGLPRWPTYDRRTRETMLFDVPPRVVSDPFRSERLFMARYDPGRATRGDG